MNEQTSGLPQEITLREIESTRAALMALIETTMDALRQRILDGDLNAADNRRECVYPLSVAPALFKGTKPAAVLFGAERVEVKTWRTVCAEILQRCIADPDRYADLLYLRNKIAGRVRVILSDKPDGMSRPLKLTGDLYFESFYDTEWLIRILTKEVLDNTCFDYSNISVAVISGRECRR